MVSSGHCNCGCFWKASSGSNSSAGVLLIRVILWADSSRHRNDFGEFFLGHHIVEGFSGSSVEALLNYFEVSG